MSSAFPASDFRFSSCLPSGFAQLFQCLPSHERQKEVIGQLRIGLLPLPVPIAGISTGITRLESTFESKSQAVQKKPLAKLLIDIWQIGRLDSQRVLLLNRLWWHPSSNEQGPPGVIQSFLSRQILQHHGPKLHFGRHLCGPRKYRGLFTASHDLFEKNMASLSGQVYLCDFRFAEMVPSCLG